MLIRLGCVRIGPRCTYSVPLRVRPAAFDLDFLATDQKSSMECLSPVPREDSRWVFSPRSKLYIRIPAKTMVMRSIIIESTAVFHISAGDELVDNEYPQKIVSDFQASANSSSLWVITFPSCAHRISGMLWE